MSRIEQLEKLLDKLEYQFTIVNESFQEKFRKDYGTATFPKVFENWYEMSYREFKDELDVIMSKTLIDTCTITDWEEYFLIMHRNFNKLVRDINETRKDIQALK